MGRQREKKKEEAKKMLKPWGTKLDFHSSGTDGLEKMREERKSGEKKKKANMDWKRSTVKGFVNKLSSKLVKKIKE